MTERKKYVVIFAYDAAYPQRVLLVEKDRPAWQKGCLNLPGGKIEEGEDELKAALRELHEEAGLQMKGDSSSIRVVGAIVSEVSIVYCVAVPVDSQAPIIPQKGETEVVQWFNWTDAARDRRLISNLLAVIPLAMSGVSGWFVSGIEVGEGVYEASIRFLLAHPVPHGNELTNEQRQEANPGRGTADPSPPRKRKRRS